MEGSEEPFAELAGAILDGTAVDWPSAESTAGEVERRTIRQLKIVAEIAQLHRRLPADSPSCPPDEAASVSPLKPLEQWGHLRILEFIGRGSFGEVYRAWNTRLDREVALKLLYPSGRQQDSLESSIIQEGRLLARVQHPNVAVIYDAERIDGRVGLWMEFVRGRTLEQILQEDSAFKEADVIEIGADLCRALSAVHEAGLLHRDIKAQNVMRSDGGRIVLMDFGTGRELEEGGSAPRDMAGTPLYLAPEVFAGRQATAQSDIYSVGVLLYHLLSGSYPVCGATIGELRQAHLNTAGEGGNLHAVCPRASGKLVRIIAQALHPDPQIRFDSAASMAAALQELMSPSGHAAGRRVAAYWMAAAACVLAVILPLVLPSGWRPGSFGNSGAKGRGSALAISSPGASARRIEMPDLMMPGKPSPDGRYFAYTESTAGNLVLLDLGSGETHALTYKRPDSGEYAAQPVFSADSLRLAYDWWSEGCRCWQLRAVGTAGGDPQILLSDKDTDGFWPHHWSQDGKLILGCLDGKDKSHALSLFSVADGSIRKLKDLPEEPYAGLSPDGRFAVYDSPKPDSPGEHGIYILATDGSQDIPLADGPWEDSHPLWLPGGSGVIFASNRAGTTGLCRLAVAAGRPAGNPEIVKKNVAGLSPIGLTDQGDLFYSMQTATVDIYVADVDPDTGQLRGPPVNPARSFLGSNSSPDWSPDGRSLAYVSRREAFGTNARVLVVQSLETGALKEYHVPLLDMPTPRWSPDGRIIAFRGRDSRANRAVHFMDIRSGAIVSKYEIAADLAWSRDGEEIYFVRIAQGLLKLDARSQAELMLYLFPAGSLAGKEGLRLSPDGRWIAFALTSAGGCSLCIAPTGGGTPIELFRSTEVLQPAGWIRDGSAVLFTRPGAESGAHKSSRVELWAVSVKGGDPQSLNLAMDSLREVRVNPDGQRIAFTSGYPDYEFWVMSNIVSEKK